MHARNDTTACREPESQKRSYPPQHISLVSNSSLSYGLVREVFAAFPFVSAQPPLPSERWWATDCKAGTNEVMHRFRDGQKAYRQTSRRLEEKTYSR
jgi:hypothetical protein